MMKKKQINRRKKITGSMVDQANNHMSRIQTRELKREGARSTCSI